MSKLLLILLLPVLLFSQNIWEERLNLRGTEEQSVINNFEVVDSNIIYFTSSRGLTNYLYKSTNQGANWELIKDLYDFDVYSINDIEIIDSVIYLAFEKGIILKSTNYGKSFIKIDIGFNNSIRDLVMFNSNSSVANLPSKVYVTNDNWLTFDSISYFYPHLQYNMRKLDETKYISQIVIYSSDKYESYEIYLHTLDIKKNKEVNTFSKIQVIFNDLYIFNDTTFLFVGKLNTISGGSGHDAVFKSTDAGKTWRTILDFRPTELKMSNVTFFGLQDIAFKNDSVGIAVGQFGKILYTYDGGESWFYEQNLPRIIDSLSPPTMIVTYAGDRAIIGDFTGAIHTLKEDNLAPKPEDTLTISGKIISEDSLAITHIPIRLNSNKITMTDEEGNYKFTKLAPGSYTVTALNKYIDSGPKEEFHFEPYLYSPIHQIDLNNSISDINFNVENIRGNYEVTGSIILNGEGVEGIEIILKGDKHYVDITDENGFFSFQNIGKWREGYTITPYNSEYNFDPESYLIYVNDNYPNNNFTASPISSVIDNPKFQIKNNILISKDITGLEYKIVTLNGNIIESGILPKELNLNQSSNGTYILNITKGDKVVYTYKYQIMK